MLDEPHLRVFAEEATRRDPDPEATTASLAQFIVAARAADRKEAAARVELRLVERRRSTGGLIPGVGRR